MTRTRTSGSTAAGPVDVDRTRTSPLRGRHEKEGLTVHGDGVRAERVHADLPRAEARHRFGGLDVPAFLAGAVAGLGTLAVLAAVAAALGTVGYQQGVGSDELSTAGLATGLVVLFLALLAGGWVAGRSARYDGARNGLLAAGLFVVLTAGIGALGSRVDGAQETAGEAASSVDLPTWLPDATTSAAVATGLLALLVVLAAGALGGSLGARWHRRVDDLLVRTVPGGIAPYPTPEHDR